MASKTMLFLEVFGQPNAPLAPLPSQPPDRSTPWLPPQKSPGPNSGKANPLTFKPKSTSRKRSFRETEDARPIKGKPAPENPWNLLYGWVSFGFFDGSLKKCEIESISCTRPQVDPSFGYNHSGLVGYGPYRADDFSLNTYYHYEQFWLSNFNQMKEFQSYYFKNYKFSDFLFPTRLLLRSHHLVLDSRYVNRYFQGGLFTRLTFVRVGSSVGGDKDSGETGTTVSRIENFVPYISYRYENTYRGQVSFPMRAEANVENPRLSNKSYSFSSSGKGAIFSSRLNNSFFLDGIDTLVHADFWWYRYKYRSITYDRDQQGFMVGTDFPIYYGLSGLVKFTVLKEKYNVATIRYRNCIDPNNTACPAEAQYLELGELVYQTNTYSSPYGEISWLYNKKHKISGYVTQEKVSSNINEGNKEAFRWGINYTYFMPSENVVSKRVNRFQDTKYFQEEL